MIKIGCCGFPVKKSTYYSEFEVVEVQKTFYDPRGVNTFRKWRDEAPKEFEFTIKAWQGVTHPVKSPTWKRYKGELKGSKDNYGLLKYTEEVKWAWEQTLEAADSLDADKIIVQLPPSLDWDSHQDNIVKTLEYMCGSGKKLIIEPRHPSWFKESVFKLFRDIGLTFCTDPFKNNIVDVGGDLIYLRLHGIGGYKYQYTDEDLKNLYNLVSKYIDAGRPIYVMFNNVYMYDDAKCFKKLIG